MNEVWHDAYAMHGECGEMDFDPAFKQAPMMEQLGRIIDSAEIEDVVPSHKYNPVQSVVTDDGHEIAVHAKEAKIIRNFVLDIPAQRRLEALKMIQTTEGLTKVLDSVKI